MRNVSIRAAGSSIARGVARGGKWPLLVAAGAAVALAVHRQARRAEEIYPPRGHFVEVDGVRLHYLDAGEGPPVVLLHGNGVDAEDFRGSGLLDLLCARYRVVAFDRPGYGYSERPRDRVWTPTVQSQLLARACEQLGLVEPVVVAHSWATLVALALALDVPASVRGLVLLSGYYFPTARADTALFAPPAIPVVGDVMRYTVSPLMARLLAPALIRKMFAPMPPPDRFAGAEPLAMMLRPSQIRAGAEEAALMLPAVMQMKNRYRHLAVPVAILTGAEDRVVAMARQSKRLAQLAPLSTLQVVPGVGHMLHYFAGRQIVEAVDQLSSAAVAATRAAAAPHAAGASSPPGGPS